MPEAISQIELSNIPPSELARELAGPVAIGTHQTSGLQLGPRLHPIKVLHRHDDGFIAFALKEDDKGFRPSFAIKASALESMFPEYVDRLTKNAYVSINAAYRPSADMSRLNRGRQPLGPELPPVSDVR